MKKLIPALALLFISATTAAETVYTTDRADFSFKTKDSTRTKLIAIPKDTELTLLERNTNTGFTKVRTAGGVEGYISSSSLTTPTDTTDEQSETPPSEAEEPTEQNTGIKADLASSKTDRPQTVASIPKLSTECGRIQQELAELKKAASQTLELKAQRDQLQERNTSIEQELNQLKHANQSKDKVFQKDWLLYGGGVAFAGILLGILLPKMGSRRRYGGWE
ncbi:MAG: TIGR04211 family SH3 domain-containing protein [Methylococcales bacterium]